MNFGSNSDKVETLAPRMCRLKFQQNSDFISNKSGHKRKNYTSKRDGKEHLEKYGDRGSSLHASTNWTVIG